MLVVAAREAQQRRLLAAGVFEALLAYLDDPLGAPGADGPVDIARLAEAAAAHAAAEELHVHAVVDYLRARHDGRRGIIGLVQVGDYALCHDLRRALEGPQLTERAVVVPARLVERGDVDALNLGGLDEEAALLPALVAGLLEEAQDLDVHLFALAEDHEVEKGRHGLRVAAARPARKH